MHMAASTRFWTIDDLDAMPDDGNTYEVVRGELFVSPPPDPVHESLAAVLMERLVAYLQRNPVGRVFMPHGVVSGPESRVEPDLTVRPLAALRARTWAEMPLPLLVVEIISPYSRRRDREQKRALYLEIGVPEYWIVDPERRTITVVRPGEADRVVSDALTWQPAGAGEALRLDVTRAFGEVLG